MNGSFADATKAKPQTCRELREFLYDPEEGSVECKLCGSRAFSWKPESIALWQAAHEQCCRWRTEGLRSA
jgi:hypothetical protein